MVLQFECSDFRTLAIMAMLTLLSCGFLARALGHGLLTIPHSKNNGFPGSFALDRQSYYTTASWWLDRAFFVLPTVTPWMRPGHFNYVDAQNLYKDFPQTFHPCGCYNPHGAEFCAGVQLAEGFGETTMGGAEPTGPTIKPPKWFLGTEQETAFNLYANHGGGYIYMLCKRDTFLQCRQDHLADPIRGSSQEQVDAYLKCIWDCFEANVLEFADTQWMDYQAQRDLNVTMKITSKSGSDTEPEGTTWRWIPIPDTTQISGGGEGLCSWDAVEAFSDAQVEQLFAEDFGPKSVCDAGPKNHNPNNWEVHDKVRVPNNLPPGAHEVIATACCFCGGGKSAVTVARQVSVRRQLFYGSPKSDVKSLFMEQEGSYALDRQAYYTTASWWLDRAFFGSPTVTPWMRPGHFNYVDAQNLYEDRAQTFHPCGCYNPHGVEFCAGVQLAEGFGETTMGGAEPSGPKVTPPQWLVGTEQETAFNLYANHGGGYVYMLCKRDSFLQCRQDHLADPIRGSSQEQVDAYLKCIWDCFEANVLDFADTQWLEYQAQRDLNVTMKITSKSGDTEPAGSTWRWIPIPDTAQISGGGEGLCSWDAVQSFGDAQVEQLFAEDFGPKSVCDAGPKVHNPNNWEVHDKVLVPNNLPPGEYLLSWRWDCYMADQIWSNCADVEIVDPNAPTTTTSTTTTSSRTGGTTTGGGTGCVDEPLPAQWSQQGRFDCTYFEERGAAYSQPKAYCAHNAISTACCFCGGGVSAVQTAVQTVRKPRKRSLRASLALIQSTKNVTRLNSEL
ncbi:unnamed protein product [Durusdinium trenchii]|uniref:Chitin-binding type-4 domain-containing protein n=1 Tax=Durusdinium trenchii TaxID=1381693 RepID=A0ABP0HP25_9DINO